MAANLESDTWCDDKTALTVAIRIHIIIDHIMLTPSQFQADKRIPGLALTEIVIAKRLDGEGAVGLVTLSCITQVILVPMIAVEKSIATPKSRGRLPSRL